MSFKALMYFLQANHLLKQASDTDLNSPTVSIEPVNTLVQKAVELLKKTDPQFFVGVRKIVVSSSSAYGHVESGPNKDPAVINVNLNRIQSEIKNKNQGADNKILEDHIVRSIAEVIAHEKGHIKSYKEESGFQGGEAPAEAEEQRISNLLNVTK